MNFKQWIIEEQAALDDLFDHIYKSIQVMNDGKWSVINKRRLLPSFRSQAYGAIELLGQNVRMPNDKFYVKVFYEVRKKTGEMKAPPEYYGGYGWWGPSNSPERTEKEMTYGEPYEKPTTYDPKIGHKLLTFRGFIEGWKPGMMPGQELDYKTSAEIKGYPISVSKPGDPRHDMERIDDFESLTTPMEVASFVITAIDKFYDSGWDQDEEDEPSPTPREPAFSEDKKLPPWEKRKRIRKYPARPVLRQTRVYT